MPQTTSKELFKRNLGLDMVHVPYKGGPQALTDLIGGQVDSLFVITSTVMPHISSGKLKALGLDKGMVITKVNNEKIATVEQLTGILNSPQNRGILLEILTESGRKDYVGFGL